MNILKSLVVHLSTKDEEIIDSDKVSISLKHSLSFIRGQVAFTSGFTISNQKGTQLFLIDEHYQRLKKSYQMLHECCLF